MSRYYYTEWNTDSNGNKKLEHIQNESHKIVNNKFFLDQVPDPWYKVKINNMFEVTNVANVANETQFKVNYDNGEITFHSNLEGSDVIVTEYYGVGLIKISSKRIVFENDGSTIVATDIDGAIKEQNSRIDNLVSQTGESNTEIVDGRNSSVKNTTYATLKNRLDASETDIENISDEIVTARKGEVNLVTKINTIDTQLSNKADQSALDITNSNVTVNTNAIATNTANIAMHTSQIATLASGSPKAVSLASQMTDITKNYVYTGSEGGYVSGNWYYHNGSSWTSGGTYQSTGLGDRTVTEEKTTLESTFRDVVHSVEYLSGNKLINNLLLQSDISITRGTFTITDGDIVATKDAQPFSYFYLPSDVSSIKFKLPSSLLKSIYLILGNIANGDFHMLGLNGAAVNKVYPVTSNGTVLGSLLSTISFTDPVANDIIMIRKDYYGMYFYKNDILWFTILEQDYPSIYKNIFGLLLPTDWLNGTVLVEDFKIVTKSTADYGIKKIESVLESTQNIWGSSVLINVDPSTIGNVNANFTKGGSVYSISRISPTYGWIYSTGNKKLHFTNTSNSPTYIGINANDTEMISIAIKGTDAGKVVKTTTTTLTTLLVKFSDVTPYVINQGDEILLTYSDYVVDIKVKRSGTSEYVNYMTRDLISLKASIDTVGVESVGLLTVSSNATTVEDLQIEVLGTLETRADQAYALALGLQESNNIDEYFSTVKWGTIGDSITANSGGAYGVNYRTLVQNLLGISYVNNVAVSGSMVARKTTHYQDANAMCLRYAALDNDCQIVTVFGGTNDYLGSGQDGVPIGIKGSTDVYDFYGALKTLIEGLITKLPSAKIAFITPLRRTNDTLVNIQGHVLKDYVNAIKDICADYSIPVLDMYSIGGINSLNSTTFQTDGLHPNTEGYEFISRKIAKFIDEL